MKEQTTDPHPLSDLAYDWITLIQNKAQALNAYDQYIKDAEAGEVAGVRRLLPQGARRRQGAARRSEAAPGRGAAGQDGRWLTTQYSRSLVSGSGYGYSVGLSEIVGLPPPSALGGKPQRRSAHQ